MANLGVADRKAEHNREWHGQNYCPRCTENEKGTNRDAAKFCIAHLIVHNLTPKTPNGLKSSEIYNRGKALANVGYSVAQRVQTTPITGLERWIVFLLSSSSVVAHRKCET